MKYSPHGDLNIEWSGNILIVYPKGSINLEGAKRFHQVVNDEITNKRFETFARIIDYQDKYCLATKEAYQELQNHVMDNLSKGCKYIGIVGENTVSRHYPDEALRKVNYPHDFFSSSALAIKYISENITGITINK
jgi:hypothetical protein